MPRKSKKADQPSTSRAAMTMDYSEEEDESENEEVQDKNITDLTTHLVKYIINHSVNKIPIKKPGN